MSDYEIYLFENDLSMSNCNVNFALRIGIIINCYLIFGITTAIAIDVTDLLCKHAVSSYFMFASFYYMVCET